MRGPEHYRELIRSSSTIGRRLLATAIYAELHGDSDQATKDELADIMRGLAESTPRDEALALLESIDQGERPGWREALQHLDPPPAWAIRELRDSFGGATALADALNTNARTIRRWVAGDRQPRGPAVAALRLLARLNAQGEADDS
jgi:DNA-binding transcriptional regulator YiaG